MVRSVKVRGSTFVLLVTATALAASALAPSSRAQVRAASAPGDDSLARARRYVSWFFTGDADSIWAHLTSAGQQAYGSPGAVRKELLGIARWGREVGLISEGFDRMKGRTRYFRLMRFDRRSVTMAAAVEFDREWHLVGWSFVDAGDLPPPDRP